MAAISSKPKTPPPALKIDNGQLLTPPSTGGSGKQLQFANMVQSPVPKRLVNTRNLEEFGSLDFTEVKNGSSDDSLSISDSISEDSTPATSPTSSAVNTPLDKPEGYASFVLALDAPPIAELSEAPKPLEPFPFMKLPLLIRKKVYENLVVIPAVICVRQKHTCYHSEKHAYLHAERRELLPGIAYALAKLTVAGYSFRFARYASSNINILRVSKEVHAEAKAVMYGNNNFHINTPSSEMSPPADFRVPLFPRGYQRLVRKLNISIRSFYSLKWLVNGGYTGLKNAYRGLDTLTINLEIEHVKKGHAKHWARLTDEKWVDYVKRLRHALAIDLFGSLRKVKKIPVWVDLRVLFDGERYATTLELEDSGQRHMTEAEASKLGLKSGLVEAFELFKKGGR